MHNWLLLYICRKNTYQSAVIRSISQYLAPKFASLSQPQKPEVMPGHKIKNWRRLLSCTESKNKLTAFLAESWKKQKCREKLGRKCMFVTSSDRCIKLMESGWQEIDDLQSTQEEADTRILLHAKHAAETIPALICIIICLGLCQTWI